MNRYDLAGLQAAFHDHLLDRPSTIAGEIADGGRIDAARRLHIYHHAYRARLLDNLRDAYEKTWTYLGDDAFDAAAHAFVDANPPAHRNLRWHGAGFPEWLAMRFPDDRDIAELALIDWQLRRAFDGPDADPLTAGALATTDWDTAGFRFVPTLCLAPLHTNSTAIWHALDQEQSPPAAQALPAAAWLMIWRKAWQPHFRAIDAGEHAALAQLLAGATFAQLCAALGTRLGDAAAAAQAGTWLGRWLQDGLIAGLTHPPR